MEKYQEAERSIFKNFRKPIWAKFIGGIKKYQLIKEGDKIAVCISGGKDSMLLAKCMQLLQKYSDFPFEVEFLVMDPGYNKDNRQLIINNAEELKIPIKIFESDIFNIVNNIEESPCYLCAKMRRGYLYRNAMKLGCNKIALGHHFDDVIETVLMSMLYSGEIKTMMPKLHSANYLGMELIRPLYLVKEADIIKWQNLNGLKFLQCACRFTEKAGDVHYDSKRLEMKKLINNFRKINPNIERNIFRSVHDINLGTVIGYHRDDMKYNFLDDYE